MFKHLYACIYKLRTFLTVKYVVLIFMQAMACTRINGHRCTATVVGERRRQGQHREQANA
jgi:hypothetical protein